MKFKDIKVGMRVFDRWYIETWGTVTEVLKTRVKVRLDNYADRTVTYDKAHVRFLELINENN